MIQYQILQIDIMRILYQTVKRITDEILGVKGLRDWSVVIRVGGKGAVDFFVATTQPLCDPPLKYIGFFNTPPPSLQIDGGRFHVLYAYKISASILY